MLAYLPYPTWIRPEIIPGLPVRWYGLMYLIAFVITYLLVMRQLKEHKLPPQRDLVLDMFFWAIVGLLIGARAFAVTIYDPTGSYLRNPLQIILPLAVVNGKLRFTGISGMSYHGGLVGAVVALVIFMRVKKLDILEWGDRLVAGIPLGYTFGRLGNFINGELYGRITKAPWGIMFPHAETFPGNLPWVRDSAAAMGIPVNGAAPVNLPRHPSQLYEAFFEGLVLWAILWFILRKRKPYSGFLIAAYMVGYGVFRFFIEYVREPDQDIGYPIRLVSLSNPAQFSLLNFTTGQILNALLIAGGVGVALVASARARRASSHESRPVLTTRKLRKKLR